MKPGDFLLGVLDFFAILLPGAMATWLVLQYVPSLVLRDTLTFGIEGQPNPSGWTMAIAFLLSSYTLGHFVFMIGSRLDGSYDRWRRANKSTERDKTYEAALSVQKSLNAELLDGEFTTLKWARAYIQVHAQHARVEIDRLEADQKFFRSLVVIAVAFTAHFVLREAALLAGAAAIVLGVLSYRRYVDQRWKMTELIYATAVIVHASETSKASKTTAPAAT